MARNNGSSASRTSGGSSTRGSEAAGSGGGGGGSKRRSGASTRNGSASLARRGSGGGASASSGRSKSNPDAASPARRAYAAGRRSGMNAVESIKSAGSRAVETVGEHPVPMALIGAGLAWLLLESRGIRPTQARIVERSREAIGEFGQTIAEAAGNAGSAIAETASSAAEAVYEGAAEVGEYAAEAASTVRETTASGYEYSREALGNLWERHPLAVSAAILSAGIAAGMLLPGTMRESNLLGGAAQSVARKVRGKGTELIEQGRRMAATGVKAVASEGRRQGITPDEIGHKVKRMASSARKAVSE